MPLASTAACPPDRWLLRRGRSGALGRRPTRARSARSEDGHSAAPTPLPQQQPPTVPPPPSSDVPTGTSDEVIQARRRRRRYGVGMAGRKETLEVAGREVTISNPEKVFFPQTGHTKLDLV